MTNWIFPKLLVVFLTLIFPNNFWIFRYFFRFYLRGSTAWAPEGSPARSRGPESPFTSIFYTNYVQCLGANTPIKPTRKAFCHTIATGAYLIYVTSITSNAYGEKLCHVEKILSCKDKFIPKPLIAHFSGQIVHFGEHFTCKISTFLRYICKFCCNSLTFFMENNIWLVDKNEMYEVWTGVHLWGKVSKVSPAVGLHTYQYIFFHAKFCMHNLFSESLVIYNKRSLHYNVPWYALMFYPLQSFCF